MQTTSSAARSFAFVLALASTLSLTMPAHVGAQSTQPTLYERIGGYDFLARFVDTAFPRVAAEPTLARLFRGHSIDSQMRQRQLIVDALCHESGGPCLYIGRDMHAVHQGLDVTAGDWAAFIAVISSALTELGVEPGVRADFLRMFEERLRPTVVTR